MRIEMLVVLLEKSKVKLLCIVRAENIEVG